MEKRTECTRWISYLRVSTVERAEKELSLTAQRRSVEDFAARHGAIIAPSRCRARPSGTDTHAQRSDVIDRAENKKKNASF